MLVQERTLGSPYKSVGNGAAAVERNGSRFGNVPFVFSSVRIYFSFFLFRSRRRHRRWPHFTIRCVCAPSIFILLAFVCGLAWPWETCAGFFTKEIHMK